MTGDRWGIPGFAGSPRAAGQRRGSLTLVLSARPPAAVVADGLRSVVLAAERRFLPSHCNRRRGMRASVIPDQVPRAAMSVRLGAASSPVGVRRDSLKQI
jgi:hypothetical protein